MNGHSRASVWQAAVAVTGVLALLVNSIPAVAGPAAPGASPVVLARATDATGRGVLAATGFEEPVGWLPFERGFERSAGPVRGGRYAIRCTNTSGADVRGASQEVVLNQKVPTPILATGYSTARDVSGSADEGYSLYLDIVYSDGTPLWGQTHPFATGTHGWQRSEVLVIPEKPIRSVRVYALFRHHTGSASFDDISLRELSPGRAAVFDGVPVSLPHRSPAARRGERPTSIVNGKGARLALDRANGLPVSLSRGGRSLLAAGEATRGFLVRDAARDSGFYGFRFPVKLGPAGSLRQEGTMIPLGLRLSATYRAQGDFIAVSGRLDDTTGRKRAVTVCYALPVPPRGLTWWDTPRQARSAAPPGTYENTSSFGAGNIGKISRFPLACLSGTGADTCLAFPPDGARVARLVYDAGTGLYYVAFDFGLAPHGPPATFRFLIAALPPGGGFRAALQRYYATFPEAYRRRVTRVGIWMPFGRISKIEHPEDFGFAFKEGDDETAWDDAHGIATFRYSEPMSWWMNIPAGVERDYAVCLDYLQRYAEGKMGSLEEQRMARATRISVDEGADGKAAVSVVDAPWARGALFIQDCNPRLPDSPDAPNRAHIAWSGRIAATLYGPGAPGVLDGEYLDSLEGWADTLDYRSEHIRYATEPLTFDTVTRRPCILQASSTLEFTRWMATDVHRRGKWMFANSTPWRFWWYAPYLDVMGTETNWLADGKYRPESDELMLYRRMVSGRKPYLLLMNTDYDAFDHTMVDRYLRRCAFYAILPSMFSHNASNNPYWENPEWYNRDRDLFRRTIPVIRDLSALGWEPVTMAATDDPEVWIERYGGTGGMAAAFTVMNAGSIVKDVRLTIPRTAQGWKTPARAVDRLAGTGIPVEPGSHTATMRLHLEPDQVMVLFVEGR